MTETPEPKEVPAVEDLTLDQLRDHFRRFHETPWGWSKMKKAKLLEFHVHQHADTDYTELEAKEGPWERDPVTNKYPVTIMRPYRLHRHGVAVKNIAAPPSDRVEEAAEAIRNSGPLPKLNSAERSALKQLVDNDFGQLKTQMQQLAHETKQGRLEAVDAEWADKVKAARGYESRVHNHIEKARQQLQHLREEASEEGFDLQVPRIENVGQAKVVVVGLREARSKVIADVDSELSQAMLAVERQRLATQRTILLSGVSAEAASFLDQLPTAQEALLAAAQERIERKELTA